MEKIYRLEGLDCPNCAEKIRVKISALKYIDSAEINLIKEELKVIINKESESDEDNINKEIEKIVSDIEPEVRVHFSEEEKSEPDEDDEEKGIVIRLIIGALGFIAGILLQFVFKLTIPSVIVYAVSCVILGYDILLKAVKNISKGEVFDENLLMSIAAICAFVIGEYAEGVAVILFYQIGEYFQDRAVDSSRRSIKALLDIRPDTARIVKDDAVYEVNAEEINTGDIIEVRTGERIPLDGDVISGSATVDTSAVTGESVPRGIHPGDQVFSGCINKDGLINIRVTKKYGESTASKIIDLVENASSEKAKTEKFVTKFAKYYTPVVVCAAVILAVVPSVITGNWQEWLRRACMFLIISCPCALVLSIPLSFFGGIGAASKHGILVKGSNYLESLSKVRKIVFDKTGTLTKGNFKLTEIKNEEGFEKEEILKLAASAESKSGHPVARAIMSEYRGELYEVDEYTEISGRGISAVLDTGEQKQSVLIGNSLLLENNGIKTKKGPKSGTVLYLAVNGSLAGMLRIEDEIKEESAQTVRRLKKIGIDRIIMLSGDRRDTVEEVSRITGIDEFYPELLPEDKLEKLNGIIQSGEGYTAFAGDGINDAPALARADVGISMGALGSDAAIEASDIVIMDDNPVKIAESVEISKATVKIAKQNIVFALLIKAVFLVLGALGISSMWMAVFADVGVSLIAVANALRLLRK